MHKETSPADGKRGDADCRLLSFDYLMLAVWLAFGGLMASGFFFPDPLILRGYAHGIHRMLIAALQLSSIASVLFVAALLVLVRRRKVQPQHVALGVLGVCFAALIAYPVFVELLYGPRRDAPIGEFHPYLQLMPPPLPARTTGGNSFNAVFLGGSTTAWGDKAGRKWTSRVEEHLRQRCSECSVEIYNQGQDWYTTLHSLINYSVNIRQHKPDAVVVMHAINDFMNNADFNNLSNGEFREDYGHYLGPATFIVRRDPPLHLLYKRFRRYWFAARRTEMDASAFPGLEPFKRNLRTIADLSEIDGARLILMTEANLYKERPSAEESDRLVMFNFEAFGPERQWTYQTALKGMSLYNDAIREVARERNAILVDLEAVLPKSLDYFLDDVHYTDLSHAIVSERVADALQPLLINGENR